jgi:NAD-dependent SIR2 family protein deacetylase
MKFSADGPDIPAELINASLRGDVVFLCGAGVSQPAGLPNFQKLTCNVYKHLGLSMDGAEQLAFKQERYEEVIGSLSRRVADRKSIYSAVAAELDADKVTDTSTQLTILRLSRDFDGKAAIVTTNFDTLFERAWHDDTNEGVRDKCLSKDILSHRNRL